MLDERQKIIGEQKKWLEYFRNIISERIESESPLKEKLDSEIEAIKKQKNKEINKAKDTFNQIKKNPKSNLDEIINHASNAKKYLEAAKRNKVLDMASAKKSIENPDDPIFILEKYKRRAQELCEKLKEQCYNDDDEPILPFKKISVYATMLFMVFLFLYGVKILLFNEINIKDIFLPLLFFSVLVSGIFTWLILKFIDNWSLKLYNELLSIQINSQNLYSFYIEHYSNELKSSINNIEKRYEKKKNEVEKSYAAEIEKINKNFNVKMNKFKDWHSSFLENVNKTCPNFNDPVWKNWIPLFVLPSFLKIGNFQEKFHGYELTTPAILPFPSSKSLIIRFSDEIGKIKAVEGIQSMILKIIALLPPGKFRLMFFDPIGIGKNVTPFLSLADFKESLITSKVWIESQHIERNLKDLTEHMGDVIQKYLRNKYSSIEEYNEYAEEVAEPYRIVVIIDFPENFTEDAAKRLVSVVQNGPKCGVYAIILHDQTKKLSHNFNINDLTKSSEIIIWENKYFKWQNPAYKQFNLELDKPPSNEIFDKIINKMGNAAIESTKVEVPFEKILEKTGLSENKYWSSNTINGIRAALGPIGANRVQFIELGEGTAQHALVGGQTGSGKSTLLHILICSLILNYNPDELELYLIDFKKGVEFKIYSNYRLPHAQVIAIESEREYGLSVLSGLDEELKKRGELFRKEAIDSIKEYRKKLDKKMPRILLLVDEFHVFFNEDDRIAYRATQLLDGLVRQGRAFGIHVLLGSQSLSGNNRLPQSIIDQMGVRIALKCSEAESRLILSDENTAARKLSRPGEAIYNSANGLIEGNNPFQVAWLDEKTKMNFLNKIAELAKVNKKWKNKKIYIFEGNAPVNVEQDNYLNSFLSNPNLFDNKTSVAWLGEPIATKKSTQAVFLPESGNNLLIIGQNNEAAMSIILVSIITLNVQYYEGIKLYILDLGPKDSTFTRKFSVISNNYSNTKLGGRKHLNIFINEINNELESREQLYDKSESLDNINNIFLIIYGLQHAKDLEPDESFSIPSYDDSGKQNEQNLFNKFSQILQDGPNLKIHTIAWVDTLRNLNRRLDRQTIKEYELFILFQMKEDDSLQIIDSLDASKLGPYRALFYNENEGVLEKFRPYSIPTDDWLKKNS